MYSRSGGHVIAVESDLAAAVSGVSGNDHALAGILALHHRAGGQVGHNGDLFADQIFRLIPLGNAGTSSICSMLWINLGKPRNMQPG